MTTMTDAQLDAIVEAKEARPELADMKHPHVVEILTNEGHPAFAGVATSDIDVTQSSDVPLDLGPRKALADEGAAGQQAKDETKPTAALSTRVAQVEGMDAGAEDFEIPALKIKQDQTKAEGAEGVTNGHLFLTIEPEGATAERTLALLSNTRGRSFWLPQNADAAAAVADRVSADSAIDIPEKLKGPICSSGDRITPTTTDHGTLSTKCKGCKYSKWREVRGKRTLDCGENYTFLVADLTEEDGEPLMQPAVYRAMKTAVKPVKRLLTNLQLAARRHKLPMAGLIVKMTTKRVEGKESYFYVPHFSKPEPITDTELLDDLVAMRNDCQGSRVEEE